MNDFKVWFRKDLSEDGESVLISVRVTDDLKSILKKSVINEETIFKNEGEEEYKRYKVKSVIYSTLRNRNRDYIFLKELVDSGKTIIKSLDMDCSEDLIEDLKENFQRIIKNLLVTEVEQQVSFKINQE